MNLTDEEDELLLRLGFDPRLDVKTQNRLQALRQRILGVRHLLKPTPGGFTTNGGFWRPTSPLPALQLALLAYRPNYERVIDVDRSRRAVYNSLQAQVRSLAQIDAALASVFEPAAARADVGLHLSQRGRWVFGELRSRTPITVLA